MLSTNFSQPQIVKISVSITEKQIDTACIEGKKKVKRYICLTFRSCPISVTVRGSMGNNDATVKERDREDETGMLSDRQTDKSEKRDSVSHSIFTLNVPFGCLSAAVHTEN